MKTTIYELLGMIKDGKAPNKIKYEGVEYYLYDDTAYLRTDKSRFFDIIRFDMLNDEVEILDEPKQIDSDIKWYLIEKGDSEKQFIEEINANFNNMREKIIELIDEVNKLKEE